MWKIQIAGARLSLRVGKMGAGGSPGLTGQPDKGSERPSLKKIKVGNPPTATHVHTYEHTHRERRKREIKEEEEGLERWLSGGPRFSFRHT